MRQKYSPYCLFDGVSNFGKMNVLKLPLSLNFNLIFGLILYVNHCLDFEKGFFKVKFIVFFKSKLCSVYQFEMPLRKDSPIS